jgi:hypothetical protein
MKTYKYCVLSLITLFFFTITKAQQGTKQLEINYTAGIPTGNFRSLTNQVSWRGLEGALLFSVTDKLWLGLETGFQDFYQKYPRQIISESGSDISAVVTNSVQVMPIMVKAKYALASKGIIEPYVSLAAGGNMITYQKYYGEFVDDRNSFGFAAQPELGVQVPFTKTKRSGFHLAAGYNFMPFKYNDADGLSHAVIKAGVSFTLND